MPGVGSIVFDVDGILIRVTNLLGEAYSSIEVTNPYEEISKIIQEDSKQVEAQKEKDSIKNPPRKQKKQTV